MVGYINEISTFRDLFVSKVDRSLTREIILIYSGTKNRRRKTRIHSSRLESGRKWEWKINNELLVQIAEACFS